MNRRALAPLAIILAALIGAALCLIWFGRVLICRCGYVKFWHGEVISSENSQHLADWYTFSHITHGFVFYALLWLVARRLSFSWRLALATLIEAGWEIIENSDAVIERYRAVTISLDYYGDSVVNSLADILAMMLGFVLASRLPVWASVLLVIGSELMLAYVIRDGLALNLVMLILPMDWLRDWQSGL